MATAAMAGDAGGAPAAEAPPAAFSAPPAGAATTPFAAGGGAASAAPSAIKFDLSKWNRADALFTGATLLLIISMFLTWYSLKETGTGVLGNVGSTSYSTNAFGTGAGGWRWLIFLVALVGIAYEVAKLAGRAIPLPVPEWQAMIGAAGLQLLLVLIALLAKPSGSVSGFGYSVSWHWGFGMFLAIIFAAAAVYGGYWQKGGAPAIK